MGFRSSTGSIESTERIVVSVALEDAFLRMFPLMVLGKLAAGNSVTLWSRCLSISGDTGGIFKSSLRLRSAWIVKTWRDCGRCFFMFFLKLGSEVDESERDPGGYSWTCS